MHSCKESFTPTCEEGANRPRGGVFLLCVSKKKNGRLLDNPLDGKTGSTIQKHTSSRNVIITRGIPDQLRKEGGGGKKKPLASEKARPVGPRGKQKL